jgi:hypothetical protein
VSIGRAKLPVSSESLTSEANRVVVNEKLKTAGEGLHLDVECFRSNNDGN